MVQHGVTLDRGHQIAQPSVERHCGRSHMAASDDVPKHSLQTPPMPDCPCLWLPSLMSGTHQLSPAFTTQTLPWMGKWGIAIQRVIMPYLVTDRS